jgi:hypothetical protein
MFFSRIQLLQPTRTQLKIVVIFFLPFKIIIRNSLYIINNMYFTFVHSHLFQSVLTFNELINKLVNLINNKTISPK